MPYYKAEDVRDHVRGQWLQVFMVIAPDRLTDAIQAGSRHVTCPVHGGAKDFRLLKDAHETGGTLCNSCKNERTGKVGFSDGFETLMFINNWTFQEALFAVGQALNIPPRLTKADYELQRQNEKALRSSKASVKAPMPVLHAKPAITAPAEIMPDELSGAITTTTNRNAKQDYEDKKMMAMQAYEAEAEDADYSDYADYASSFNELDAAPVAKAPVAKAPVAKAPVAKAPAAKAPAAKAPVGVLTAPVGVAPEWLEKIEKQFAERAKQQKQYMTQLAGRIDELVKQCITLDQPEAEPVWKYLHKRQIILTELDATNILFHPSLAYYGGDDVNFLGNFPAIVCLIKDKDGNLVTLHRIYITNEGDKLSIPELDEPTEVKKMMTIPEGRDIIGAAIRTGEPVNGVLGVAEGLETALASMVYIDIPVWACINATLMERWTPPADVHTVIVWADKDKSNTGQTVAQNLADRLGQLGVTVFIMTPTIPIPDNGKGVDWNDVLKEQGFLGFPKAADIWSAVLDEKKVAYA